MNYLSQLTENEVRYICSVIPLRDSVIYFKKNPKEFGKIMPGFRAKSMKNQDQVCDLLFRSRSQIFISSFIEKHISNWLSQIQDHIEKKMGDGDSRELALLQTLPSCFFADNVALFFKLNNEEYSEEYLALLSAAIIATKQTAVQQDKLQKELKVKDGAIKNSQTQLDLVKSCLEKTNIKLNERKVEIKKLKRDLTNFEMLKSTIQKDKEMIVALELEIQLREKTINSLKSELTKTKSDNKHFEAQIKTELEKQQAAKIFKQQVTTKPKCPRDIEEFKDYLGYNLENIGVPTNTEYYALLKEHLSKILFQGIPIIINRGVAPTLIKCITNALAGRLNVKTLSYNKDLSIDDINRFLLSAERIVCLDNFIGNCNETELLPLLDAHKNKVIFLTVAYDRTLHYVSKEFLRYCQYLNLNRIAALSTNAELTEDPSTLDEIEFEPQRTLRENRYVDLLKKILCEFGIPRGLVDQKYMAISDEEDLCCILAFDILPYCTDVLHIAPYNTSERLNKYAGDAGRCSYRNLFKGWFA